MSLRPFTKILFALLGFLTVNAVSSFTGGRPWPNRKRPREALGEGVPTGVCQSSGGAERAVMCTSRSWTTKMTWSFGHLWTTLSTQRLWFYSDIMLKSTAEHPRKLYAASQIWALIGGDPAWWASNRNSWKPNAGTPSKLCSQDGPYSFDFSQISPDASSWGHEGNVNCFGYLVRGA